MESNTSTSPYLLSQLIKSYTEEQRLAFFSQISAIDIRIVNSLVEYSKNKKEYIHKECKFSQNDYIFINKDHIWINLTHYENKNAIRNGNMLVEVSAFNLIEERLTINIINNDNTITKQEIPISYAKKIDLY